MGKINVLPEKVISKIAAGEVVERPSSVLKELLENSIDAKSSKIFVEIEKAGEKLIKVVDNGVGIDQEDIGYVFSRYATSKIKDEKDLEKILSLGFRGEALYSIGVVSDVILRSRSKGDEIGTEIHIRGGKELSRKKVGMSEGTIVEVRELFFNTPVRKKFLKSDTTELRQILNVFLPYAILFYNVEFKLIHNKREIFYLPTTSDLKERVKSATGINSDELILIEKKFDNFSVNFLLGNINIQRPRRDLQFLYVNKRPVYNFNILNSINRVYRAILPPDVYPAFFIMIEIDPEMVDVNIHPTKREIKIKNENEIIKLIGEEIYYTLVEKGKGKKVERKSVYIERKEEGIEPQPIKERGIFDFKTEDREETKEKDNLKNKLKDITFIGVLKNKYIFFQGEETLFVFDQHAVHERINYEKFLAQIKSKNIEIQKLLTPIIVKLTKEEMVIYEEIKEKIENCGFLTTRWSEDEVAIHGYPTFLKNPEFSLRTIFTDIVSPQGPSAKIIDEEKIARSACRSSIMAGDKISEGECLSLIKQLLKCENPFVCPHGRPTVIEFPISFFDRQFLR
ncbi:MAG TPA: DNA mismatch repair endonuclease MutL [bacterium]|nr:DNA mismatch repair endonuclease MutL [bacterium]